MSLMRVTNWNEFQNFSRREFDHGGPEMVLSFMRRLQQARDISKELCQEIGVPEIVFSINSGSRDEERNRQVGGTPDSTHLYGCACDIRALTSREKFVIVKSLILAGFTRIFIYSNFIHVDCGELLMEIEKHPYVLNTYE